jgi:hypothetical protein
VIGGGGGVRAAVGVVGTHGRVRQPRQPVADGDRDHHAGDGGSSGLVHHPGRRSRRGGRGPPAGPRGRPEVSSLLLLAALCLGRDPGDVAADIGAGGAARLKEVVTAAVNETFAPVRARRAEYARDLGYVRQVLREGNDRAGAIAAATLDEVRAAMGTRY